MQWGQNSFYIINIIFKFVSAFATTSEYYIRICWWYYRNKRAETVCTRSRERIPNSGTKRFVSKYFSICFVLVTLRGPACGFGGWGSIARKSWKFLYTKWNLGRFVSECFGFYYSILYSYELLCSPSQMSTRKILFSRIWHCIFSQNLCFIFLVTAMQFTWFCSIVFFSEFLFASGKA